MEQLFFLLLICTCYGLVIDIPKTQQIDLEAPRLLRMASKDDPNNITSHEVVTWSEVENTDKSDPVIGYKLKVWEIKKIKEIINKVEGDKIVQVVKETYPKMDPYVVPDGVPTEIITPAGETTATFWNVFDEVPYQFAVLAFTAKGEGRLSKPTRITLHFPNKTMNVM